MRQKVPARSPPASERSPSLERGRAARSEVELGNDYADLQISLPARLAARRIDDGFDDIVQLAAESASGPLLNHHGPESPLDPRTAAHVLVDLAFLDGERAQLPQVPPCSYPFPQAPDEYMLLALFAGKALMPVEAHASRDNCLPKNEAEIDEAQIKQAGARPQQRSRDRLKDKQQQARDDKERKPRRGDKIEPREDLPKAKADKLEAQRVQAEKDLADEPKLEQNVPKLEGKKSDSLEEQKGPPPKPGGGTDTVGGGDKGGGAKGGGDDADVAAWKARQESKVEAIKAPLPVSDYERYVTTFQEARTTHRATTKADEAKAIEDAAKVAVVKDAPDNTPKFPDPDEVADARKLVEAKARRKLSPQPLLDMTPSPLGNQPLVGMGLRRDQEGNTHIIQEVAVDDTGRQLTPAELQAKKDKGEQFKMIDKELVVVDGASTKKPGRDQLQIKTPRANESIEKNLEALKEAGAEKQGQLKKKADIRGATVSDDRTPPPIQVPDFAKIDVSDVIAKLMAEGETTQAIEVVEKARAVFAGGAMTTSEAAKFVPLIAPNVKSELQKVADAAGVTAQTLEKKIDDERIKKQDDVAAKKSQVQAEYDKSLEEIEKNRGEVSSTISNLYEDMERKADEQAAAAKGGVDPVEVRKKAKQYKSDYEAIVQHWCTEYKRATEQRKTNLKTETGKQVQAFTATAEIDYQQIDLQLGITTRAERETVMADPNKPGYLLYNATTMWLDKAKRERSDMLTKLTTAAETEGKGYADEMEAAGEQAASKIDDWADRRIGRERGWWERLIKKVLGWLSGYRESTRKWNDIAVQDNLANLSKDNIWIAQVQMNFNESLAEEEVEADESLNEEQKAMMKVLVASKGKDSVGALAAGLISRISQQQRPFLLTKFNEEVMTWTDADAVERIGVGEGKIQGFAETTARAVHEAGVGMLGTNEKGIFDELSGLTAIQGRAVELVYKRLFHRDMRADLKGELHDTLSSGSGDYDRSIQLLEGKEAAAIAVELNQAMHETFLGTGWGTDSDKMHQLMKGKSPVQVAAIRAEYKRLYGKDLIAEAHGELDDGWSTQHDVQRFDAYVEGDQRKARTIEADQAMRGSAFFGLRTDRKALEGVYRDIDAEVEKEAKEKGWSTDRVQREIAARYAELDEDYENKYGADFHKDKRKPGESALRTSIRESFTWGTGKAAYNFTTSTGDLDILLSFNDVGRKKDSLDIKQVFQQHRAEVSTAKIQIEHRGIFYADDKEIQKALNAPSEAAYRDNLRDESLKLDKERDKAFAQMRENKEAELENEKDPIKRKEIRERYKSQELKLREEWAPTGDTYAERMRKAKKEARAGAERDAGVTFEMMQQTWDQRYRGWNKQYNLGEDKSFEQAVKGDTGSGWLTDNSGEDVPWRTAENEKTLALLKGKGFISEEDKLYFAIKGGGTDEDISREVFAEADSVESAELLKNLGTKRLGIKDSQLAEQKAREWVQSDFSGREAQDQEIAMMGVPRTPEEHTAIARRRLEMERNSGSRESLRGLELTLEQFERVEAEAQKLRSEGKGPGHPEWDKIDSETSQLQETLQRTVDIHRAQVDAVTDAVTNVVTGVVTAAVIAISILAAPVTGGASAVAGFAAMTAVLGAVAATVTNIAVKMALKGDAYGWEDIGYDAAVGLVEAVASGLTASLGDKFLKAAFLAKMAQGSLISRLAAHGLANAAEGVIQALPGALAGTVLNDELMRGPNPMAAVLMGTMTQVGMAGAMSGGMGGLFGGIRKPKQFITPGASQYDDLFAAYQKKFPGTTHEKFRADLHTTILTGDHPGLGKKELAEVARETMLASADRETQKAFKRVKVEVVTAEEFAALTRSAKKGEAVVMFRGGEPTVVVKAGTDFKNLRREVPHLMQSVAEDTKKLVAKLDESAMRNWTSLPIEQQVDIYKTKFELELHAHEKMLADLDTKRVKKQLGEAAVEAEREYLENTLANIKKKMMEVDTIDLDAIKAGTRHPPEFWDQPPRLFSKEEKFGTWEKAIDSGAVQENFELNRSLKRAEVADAFNNGYVVVTDKFSDSMPKLQQRILPDGQPVPIKNEKILVATGKSHNLEFKVVDREGYPDPPAGHYWAETGETGDKAQKYQLRKLTDKQVKAAPAAMAAKLNSLKELQGQRWFREVDDQGEVTWSKESVTHAEHDWATRHKNLGKGHTAASAVDGFDKKLAELKLPTDADEAVIRRWAQSIHMVENLDALGPPLTPDERALLATKKSQVLDDALAALKAKMKTPPGPLTETQYQAFYKKFRERFAEVLNDVPGPTRMKLLHDVEIDGQKGLLNALPENASKGHFFREVVRKDLEKPLDDGMARITRLKDFPLQHKTAEGAAQRTRDFDDVLEVHSELGLYGPKMGKWFAEYKSGENAFKLDQALDYAMTLKKPPSDAKPEFKDVEGVAMILSSKAEAEDALKKLATAVDAEGKLKPGVEEFRTQFGSHKKPGFHIGFYNTKTGQLEFLPKSSIDQHIEPDLPNGPGTPRAEWNGAEPRKITEERAAQWVEVFKESLDPDQVAALGKMSTRKTAKEVYDMFGGDAEAARVRVLARVKEAQAAKERNEASLERVKALEPIVRNMIMKDEEIAAFVRANVGKSVKNILPDVRDKVITKILVEEIKMVYPDKDGYEVLSGIKIYEVQKEKTIAEWLDAEKVRRLAATPSNTDEPTSHGLASRGENLVRQTGELDIMVVKRGNPGEKAKIVHREEVKTGKHDTHADADSQIVESAQALAKGASDPKMIVMEKEPGKDISYQFDLASDATATKQTRGPLGKGFQKNLGLTAGDLENMLESLIKEAQVKKMIESLLKALAEARRPPPNGGGL